MLNIQSVTASFENVVFSVTITYLDGTVVWEAVTTNNMIVFEELNRLDINLSLAGKNKKKANVYFIEKKIYNKLIYLNSRWLYMSKSRKWTLSIFNFCA